MRLTVSQKPHNFSCGMSLILPRPSVVALCIVYCTRGQKTQTVGDGNIHMQRQDIITTQSQSLPRAVVCLESYITLPQYLNWAVVNITSRIISHHNAILDTFFIQGEKLRLQIWNVDGETRPSVKNCNWSYLAAWQIVVKTDEVAWMAPMWVLFYENSPETRVNITYIAMAIM